MTLHPTVPRAPGQVVDPAPVGARAAVSVEALPGTDAEGGPVGPRGWLGRHRVVGDAGLALTLFVLSAAVDTYGPDGRRPGALWFDAVLAAALVGRRWRTGSTGIVVAAVCLLQWATGTIATGPWAVLVVLYTLGTRERRRWVMVVAVLTGEIGVLLAVSRWAPPQEFPVVLATGSCTVLASLLLGVHVRVRRAYLESVLQRARNAERDRGMQIQLAVTAERARMAREIHDIVAHSISVMITLNDAAVAVQPTSPASAEIRRASMVGREALHDMRRLVGILHGDDPEGLAPQPTAAELPDLVDLVRRAGLRVELSTTGDLGSVPAAAQLEVYRIVQESLTNVLKHARNVTRVSVEVAVDRRWVTAVVTDDGDPVRPGAGPDTADGSAASGTTGHGLTGVRERAALFGGTAQAGPGVGRGWTVHASLSVDPDGAHP